MELVRLGVAVIVATPAAVVAASKATVKVPIVMINVGDPVELGLIASLAHPGGNVTGSSFTIGTENLRQRTGDCSGTPSQASAPWLSSRTRKIRATHS